MGLAVLSDANEVSPGDSAVEQRGIKQLGIPLLAKEFSPEATARLQEAQQSLTRGYSPRDRCGSAMTAQHDGSA